MAQKATKYVLTSAASAATSTATVSPLRGSSLPSETDEAMMVTPASIKNPTRSGAAAATTGPRRMKNSNTHRSQRVPPLFTAAAEYSEERAPHNDSTNEGIDQRGICDQGSASRFTEPLGGIAGNRDSLHLTYGPLFKRVLGEHFTHRRGPRTPRRRLPHRAGLSLSAMPGDCAPNAALGLDRDPLEATQFSWLAVLRPSPFRLDRDRS